jgi:2-polyprenyl-3-methyl-5-hydroxy-6-metoxy-1,4-benzoquinol methylase
VEALEAWLIQYLITSYRLTGRYRQTRGIGMDNRSTSRTQAHSLKAHYERVYAKEQPVLPTLHTGRWPRNRWEALVRYCPPARRVLEIGCGSGVVLFHLADRCQELAGTDLADDRCEIARRNLAGIDKPVEIFQGNIEAGIDKPDGYYDVILWADVIEHVVDIFAVMHEAARLLAPGGTLITATPNMAYFRNRIKLLLGKFPSTSARDQGFAVRPGEMYDGGHLHYLVLGVLQRLYQHAGLVPIQTVGFGRAGKAHHLWPALLSGSAMVVGKKPQSL